MPYEKVKPTESRKVCNICLNSSQMDVPDLAGQTHEEFVLFVRFTLFFKPNLAREKYTNQLRHNLSNNKCFGLPSAQFELVKLKSPS